MIEVRNLLFQPVSLHLAGDGRGFHIGPREKVQVRDDQVSLEMQMAARRGLITLTKVVEEAEKRKSTSKAAPPSASVAEARPARRRKVRQRAELITFTPANENEQNEGDSNE